MRWIIKGVIRDFIVEWEIRIWRYFFIGSKIILKNPGIIQWDDKSIHYRKMSQARYTLEDYEKFMKELN